LVSKKDYTARSGDFMERVNVISGKSNIIIIAPHGVDDPYTDVIAERMADTLGAYAVINQGFERGDQVDVFNDKANCNDVEHCHEDVVREEFLDPILKFVAELLEPTLYPSNDPTFIFIIHGVYHLGKISPDMIVGYGAGKPDSFSMDAWRKDAFVHLLEEQGLETFQGKPGGRFSGWAKSNLNQLFRKWYYDPNVQSIQLEISRDWRTDKQDAKSTAETLSRVVEDFLIFSEEDFKALNPPAAKEF
jgi:hypothetical protein